MNHVTSVRRSSCAVPVPLPHLPADHGPVPNPLPKLLEGHDLDSDEAEHLFERLVLGRLAEGEMAALLIALRMKGETADELIGAARALGKAALPFERPSYRFADCCGTGGDSSGSINVSTATGFVAAACGLPIAKHGNRSVSSRCGSADVLETLGARIDGDPARARTLLDEVGFCFLFAPAYHSGMRHAGPVRRQLAVRTVMNFLGPCLNPARPKIQLLGVADPTKLRRIARVLDDRGVEQALVVHGDGLDEVALHGTTTAIRLDRGEIEDVELAPEDAGLARASAGAIAGGDPADNAARMLALLEGRTEGAERDIVLLNTAALLTTAGLSADLRMGVALARDALRSGSARRVLSNFIEASHG